MAESQETTNSSAPAPPCSVDRTGFPRLRPTLREAGMIAVCVAPFWLIYVAHFTSPNGEPTGFIQYDMPYYVANGREIFERGNGFAYPNPFDPSPDPPVIYCHWLMWGLGVAVVQLGLDPGLVFVGLGVVGGLTQAWLTLCLVKHFVGDSFRRDLIFFGVMWGGGLLCVTQAVGNAVHGRPLVENLLALDPSQGDWFLNWGRNLIFPTETIYHALTAACWLGALRNRWWWSLGFAVLVATTHPWSGLEVLGTTAAFWTWRVVREKRPRPIWIVSGLCVAVFLAYNLVWLDRFPQHRSLHDAWMLDWSLPALTALLAWGPVATVALLRAIRIRWTLTTGEQFLACAFAVALFLSLHDRFMNPTQPLHFTRGYVWMPLCLLALPLIDSAMARIAGAVSRPVAFAATLVAGVLVVFDNSVYISVTSGHQWSDGGLFFLSADQRELFDWADTQRLEGVLLHDDTRPELRHVGYLSATYTGLRPWYGHIWNTPDAARRRVLIPAIFLNSAAAPESIGDVRYLVLARGTPVPAALQQIGDWKTIHETSTIALLERVDARPPLSRQAATSR